jgi:thiamine-monophosphate kinase
MKTEFELINAICTKSKTRNPKLKIGIGDDCAVICQNSQTDLVVTTDLLIEDIDFKLDWSKPEFVGHKALAASLSDIAAMGAKPVWALISIGVPEKIWASDFVERFYDGWLRLARKFAVELAGGDISRAPDKIVIDSIAAGETRKNRAILRSGAQAGDFVFVTGNLGGAAAGLRLLESGKTKNPASSSLIQKQLCPDPQTKIGLILGEKRLATAMIDLSDGLSSDLRHLCEASKTGAKIYAEKIPIHPKLKSFKEFRADALRLALDGGEDFELLFTANPKNAKKIEKLLPAASRIGEITANAGRIELCQDSKNILIEPRGFRHFGAIENAKL